MLRVGLPIGIATVAEVGVFLGATLYAATLGAADVAAHTLTLRTAGVAYAVPTALLQASMVRMARADSLGDRSAARAVVAASLALSLVLRRGDLPAARRRRGAARRQPSSTAARRASPRRSLALSLFLLLGLIEFVANPGLAAAGLLRGRKDTRAPMLYVLVGNWAIGAPLGLALCEFGGLGIIGLWIGLAAGTLATAPLTLARLHRVHFTRVLR